MMTAGVLVLAYLVGSIPFGYLLVRVVKGLDVREYGSQSIGATNVARVGGVWLGLATLAADVGKATGTVLVAHRVGMSAAVVAAAAFLVMVGHAYSLWFVLCHGRFAEGKSVACALGVMIGLARIGVLPWQVALAPLALWAVGLLAPRVLTGRWYWISPVTMVASACIPAAVWAAHPPRPYLILSAAMAALILVRHRNNIRRLIAGTEPRLGERPRPLADAPESRPAAQTEASWMKRLIGLRGHRARWRRLALLAFVVAPGLVVGRRLRVTPVRVPLPVPTPVRVAVLGDFHLNAAGIGTALAKQSVQEAMRQRPDAIVLLGDYASGRRGLAHLPSVFGDIEAPLGVYAVLGNHEHWTDATAARESLEALGIRVLVNESVVLRKGEARLALVGVDDLWTGKVDWQAAFRSVPKGVPVVLVSHNPDAALFPQGRRASLILSGHTHGGLIGPLRPVLRGINRLTGHGLPPGTRYGRSHLSGLFREPWGWVYVTAGVTPGGVTPRWFLRPEVAVIDLVPSELPGPVTGEGRAAADGPRSCVHTTARIRSSTLGRCLPQFTALLLK
jgi:acyl-phosphate glycerol 3-phosphate acyltransferase